MLSDENITENEDNNTGKANAHKKLSQGEKELLLAKVGNYLMKTNKLNSRTHDLVSSGNSISSYCDIHLKDDGGRDKAVPVHLKNDHSANKMSQAERDAILAKISYYLMTTKTQISTPNTPQPLLKDKAHDGMHILENKVQVVEKYHENVSQKSTSQTKSKNCDAKISSSMSEQISLRNCNETKTSNKWPKNERDVLLAKIGYYLMGSSKANEKGDKDIDINKKVVSPIVKPKEQNPPSIDSTGNKYREDDHRSNEDKRYTLAEKESIVAKISYYLLETSTKKSFFKKTKKSRTGSFVLSNRRSSMPDIQGVASEVIDQIEDKHPCSDEDSYKDKLTFQTDFHILTREGNTASNKELDDGNEDVNGSNRTELPAKAKHEKYTPREKEAILAKISLYLLDASRYKSNIDEDDDKLNNAKTTKNPLGTDVSNIDVVLKMGRVKHIKNHLCTDISNIDVVREGNKRQVNVVSNHKTSKSTQRREMSQSERDAVLARISYYLMGGKGSGLESKTSTPLDNNDFKSKEYECNSEIMDSITYTSEKTSYEGIQSFSIDRMERTESKFSADIETRRKSRSMDKTLVNISTSKDTPVKWTEAQREAILARISFYLMGNTKSRSIEKLTSPVYDNQNRILETSFSSQSELDSAENYTDNEKEARHINKFSQGSETKNIDGHQYEQNVLNMIPTKSRNESPADRGNSSLAEKTDKNNTKRQGNTRWSQKEKESVLAKISLYLMNNTTSKDNSTTLDSDEKDASNTMLGNMHTFDELGKDKQIKGSKLDKNMPYNSAARSRMSESEREAILARISYYLMKGNRTSQRMAKTAAVATTVHKFTEKIRYSQAEREAILSEISLCLMDSQTSSTAEKEFRNDSADGTKAFHKSFESLPDLSTTEDEFELERSGDNAKNSKFNTGHTDQKNVDKTKSVSVENRKYTQNEKDALLAKISLYLMDLTKKYKRPDNKKMQNEAEVLLLINDAYASFSTDLGTDTDSVLDDNDTLLEYSENDQPCSIETETPEDAH